MEYQQNQTFTGEYEDTYNYSFHKLMRMFTISLLISFVGTLVGTRVDPVLMFPLVIVQLVMIFASMFIRRRGKPIGYAFTYIFCFISGITLYSVIGAYVSRGAGATVTTALLLTVLIFVGLSVYAYNSKRDFSFLGGILMVGLFALIGLSLIGLFLPGLNDGVMGLAISFAGILIFSGFILYDISRYKHGVPDEMIPLAVLSLYLSFINLFLYLLQFLGLSRD
ncbi:Bax inhibitor-1/YccA family protein [Chengkuizengella axinellae]|uniref:Bax inhibitor-1/YccA family protein n=1 Tax=Chengkuizengella axinellae TaxID=3064388 RepID=A0ABT9J648_9BACL|nr:Bax inhibitor-1/YccA family protein [Chengkuizengella sp. 2205SS18-9]MDP5277092.1 Bax inhibitor-1/YccA family protein [Chengkuizengella sp. 2205SS18-9]